MALNSVTSTGGASCAVCGHWLVAPYFLESLAPQSQSGVFHVSPPHEGHAVTYVEAGKLNDIARGALQLGDVADLIDD